MSESFDSEYKKRQKYTTNVSQDGGIMDIGID